MPLEIAGRGMRINEKFYGSLDEAANDLSGKLKLIVDEYAKH